ncbi:ATP-dependent Clp protease adaptor ClpS [Telmatocola sphagniphila]|uniref:ATP-dependent Clp protease adapter protein ClpS n=1 Tax=Telmatocola sphagniphila TaxID=1123043 RepID=A0A8E6ETY8_9BACT|nr:ATP-dependent Clp protease adaptor ClpS [Telmatocola sphagniphila]QVL30577.1 ATP-dependent Clp protease adaptor ClpS [Telmatocola sphagniphila]
MIYAFALPITESKEETAVKLLPPYHVILENDDDHTMDFVIFVLREVFKYDQPKAYSLMLEAHEKGQAIVWTGAKEVAELKLEQIQTFHEKHPVTGKNLGSLGSRIEPAA